VCDPFLFALLYAAEGLTPSKRVGPAFEARSFIVMVMFTIIIRSVCANLLLMTCEYDSDELSGGIAPPP